MFDFWGAQRVCGNRWSCPQSGVTFDPRDALPGAWQEVKGKAMLVVEADYSCDTAGLEERQ